MVRDTPVNSENMKSLWVGDAVHNPSTWEARQKDYHGIKTVFKQTRTTKTKEKKLRIGGEL